MANKKHKLLIVGAGKIGAVISLLLLQTKKYVITVADRDFAGVDYARVRAINDNFKTAIIDITQPQQLDRLLTQQSFDAVISSLPYFLTLPVAKVAAKHQLHYFDLTEDVTATREIRKMASGAPQAMVPGCGLAPGFLGMLANALMQDFDELDAVKLCSGALPSSSSHPLQYAITWSVDGLINEYINPCYGIVNGEQMVMQAMADLETIQIDGASYEAFNTSGGIGGLADLYVGKINSLSYKTIRYPGHCEKIQFLLQELRLQDDRPVLKKILENSLPRTYQDVVVVYISILGKRAGRWYEHSHSQKIYPAEIGGKTWSAIQVATAAGVCAVADHVMQHAADYHGYIHQEELPLNEIQATEFGEYLRGNV